MKRPWDEPTSCAPERRRDPVTGQWYVLAPDRAARPIDPAADPNSHAARLQESVALGESTRSSGSLAGDTLCDFCRGQESATTPTRVCFGPLNRPEMSTATTADWQVRVVENLYPAFCQPTHDHDTVQHDTVQMANGETSREGLLTESAPSAGWHEVIIEAPQHCVEIASLSEKQLQLICRVYQQRFLAAAEDPRIRHALLFKNNGRLAGMSRQHVHSQFVALPETPPLVGWELAGSYRYHRRHSRCVFCDLLDQAIDQRKRVVWQSEHFVAFCPHASRTAYEMWIVPRQHQADFRFASKWQLDGLAQALSSVLRALHDCLKTPAFNYVFHSSPFDMRLSDHYHWHIEIIPRQSFLAGLEWGSGILVNTLSPERAADRLRNEAKQ